MKIDFKSQFERAYRFQAEQPNEEDLEMMQREEDLLIQERMKLAERKYVNFFNPGALSLI